MSDLTDVNASWRALPPEDVVAVQIRNLIGAYLDLDFEDGPARPTTLEDQQAAQLRLASEGAVPEDEIPRPPAPGAPVPFIPRLEVHGARPAFVRGA